MIKITDYNKSKAKKWFALLKIFEIIGAFLFTFGIYGLGNLAITSTNWRWRYIFWEFKATTISRYPLIGVWGTGFGIICLTFFYLVLICLVCALVYLTIKGYLNLNWYWSKLIAENPTSKKKRLEKKRQEELADDEKCRKKNGGFIPGIKPGRKPRNQTPPELQAIADWEDRGKLS